MLTGLQTGNYDQIMRWWSSKPQSGIATVLGSVTYCYVLLYCLPCYSSSHFKYHTRSFYHQGVACLRPRISTKRTISSSHPGIYHLRPRIPTSHSTSLPSPGFYCMDLSTRRLLIFFSRKIYAKVSLICFSTASWRHHDSLLNPPSSWPFSHAHTSNISHSNTHCATVACRLHM